MRSRSQRAARAAARGPRQCLRLCTSLRARRASRKRGLPAQGAVVANYPWDGSEDRGTHYAACPDDAAYVHLAGAYARAHASMAASAEFPGGITNGAAWYPLWGGMQARWTQGLGMTLEAGAGAFPGKHARPRAVLAAPAANAGQLMPVRRLRG